MTLTSRGREFTYWLPDTSSSTTPSVCGWLVLATLYGAAGGALVGGYMAGYSSGYSRRYTVDTAFRTGIWGAAHGLYIGACWPMSVPILAGVFSGMIMSHLRHTWIGWLPPPNAKPDEPVEC